MGKPYETLKLISYFHNKQIRFLKVWRGANMPTEIILIVILILLLISIALNITTYLKLEKKENYKKIQELEEKIEHIIKLLKEPLTDEDLKWMINNIS